MREELIEEAFAILNNVDNPVEFKELWTTTLTNKNLSEEQALNFIADFYSDLTLDNRFIGVEKTKWDLRSRRTSKEAILDTSRLLFDEEDEIFEEIAKED